ncbi:tubulin-folding cofactor B [Anopheles bellator]|uniref:tubulin-folding cofactor B n=1 Tax=Anopheles bellator TaxID=139047 RepID=UPI0026485C4D|nr:tubulin-folding cofactor B [Anopheles bellator]
MLHLGNGGETSDTVTINISNSHNDAVSFERKYSRSQTVNEFKVKLEPITGGSAGTMQLELYSGDRLVCKLDSDSRLLGSYPVEDGMRVHVVDNFQFIQENVAKFELSTEEYDKKSDSVRSFLRKNKLGKYNEAEMAKLEEERKRQEAEDQKKIDETAVGARCRVTTKGHPTRLGTVLYKGELEGKPGLFFGVKFDEPLGVNDGSVNGKRYFDCPPKYGSFVALKAVEVGDFPPEEFSLDDEL